MIQVNLLPESYELSKLISLLSSDLREEIFFPRLSSQILALGLGDQVEISLCYNDDSTKLIARNGEYVESSQELARGAGPSGYVVKTKRAYYSNSVSSDPVFSTVEREGITSELIIPLSVEGNILATIHVQSRNEDVKYGDDSLAVVKEFLNQIELPLGNINLYLMTKFLNRELMGKISTNDFDSQGVESSSREEVEMIGQNEELLKAISMGKRVAKQDFPILLKGSIGSGKRLLAKKIHFESLRAGADFRVIECKTHSEDDFEKELFGFEGNAGVWEQVNGGTLVLNDIASLSAKMQSKIFATMVSGSAKRYQGQKGINLNARIIATSQTELKDSVAAGKFREDLFYRLATVSIELPHILDRGDDIKILANHFLNMGKSEKKVLTPQAQEELLKYTWKSNILELRNAMERTYALTEGRYVESLVMEGVFSGTERDLAKEAEEKETFSPVTLQDLERKHICKTLEFLNGNKTRAAKSLGITVKTLYNKLHSYGLISKAAQ